MSAKLGHAGRAAGIRLAGLWSQDGWIAHAAARGRAAGRVGQSYAKQRRGGASNQSPGGHGMTDATPHGQGIQGRQRLGFVGVQTVEAADGQLLGLR
jgi:hypothetical protein